MLNQQLMDYFKFDQADLIANQRGLFTEKQRARILSEDTSNRTWGRVGGIGLLFIAAIGFFGAVVACIQDSDWGFRIGFGLGFGCIWPLVWGGLGFGILSSAFSKHEFVLAKVQGRVNIVREESYSSSSHSTTISHELHIGGKEFSVEDDLANVMMQGDEYILYYIADSSEILSAEPVAQAK
ncbi:MAG: hypothetical protein WA821_21680 [Anaerolineales bacterium]